MDDDRNADRSTSTDLIERCVGVRASSSDVSCVLGIESTSRDCNCSAFGAEDAAKFDAVLTAVQKLIDSLNVEMGENRTRDNDIPKSTDGARFTESRLKSDDTVADERVAGAGAESKQAAGRESADKEVSNMGWRMRKKKLDVRESRAPPSKENKALFAEGESTSTSGAFGFVTRSQGAEVAVERRAHAIAERGTFDLKKQMTQDGKKSSVSEKFIKLSPSVKLLSLDEEEVLKKERKTATAEANNLESPVISESAKSIAYERGEVNLLAISEFVDEVFRTSPETSPAIESSIERELESSFTPAPLQMRDQMKNTTRSARDVKESVVETRVLSNESNKSFLTASSRKIGAASEKVGFVKDAGNAEHRCNDSGDNWTTLKTNIGRFGIAKMFNKRSHRSKKPTLMSPKKFFRGFSQSDSGNEKKQSKKSGKRSTSLDEKTLIENRQNQAPHDAFLTSRHMTSQARGLMTHAASEPSHMQDLYFKKQPSAVEDKTSNSFSTEVPCSNPKHEEQEQVVFRVQSEPKLPPVREDDSEEVEEQEEEEASYSGRGAMSRSSSDFLMGSESSAKWLSDNDSAFLSPLDRSPMELTSAGHSERLGSTDLTNAAYSRRFLGSSQDSLLSDKPTIGSAAERQGDATNAWFSKKTKSLKFRKTLKNVGKASSVPVQRSDENAERIWSSDGSFTWSNVSGKRVELRGTHLQTLSELECDALKKVARKRLQEIDIGVTIVEPKDESQIMKRKMSAKKKYGVLTSKDKSRDKSDDHVFGIPLINVVENDQLLRLQKSFSPAPDCHHAESSSSSELSPAIAADRSPASVSSSDSSCSGSTTSINHQENSVDDTFNSERRVENAFSEEEGICLSPPSISSSTIPDGEFFSNKDPSSRQTPTGNSNKFTGNGSATSQSLRRRCAAINDINPDETQLLEALNKASELKSGSQHSHKKVKDRSILPPTMPQVPYVVQKCCDHIKKYGLDVTGIFRIAGSKKRVKQLREEFDQGIDVTIEEDYNSHDVAALLKEFFRDLPEALLTRELYPAFIQTAKMIKHQRLDALRYLLWLLPLSNRDTLNTLLNFLEVVAAHSEEAHDHDGNKTAGNKMSVGNLAVIFGPNILHRYKKSQAASDNHYQGPNLERPEDSTAVVKVVEELISHQCQLFQVPRRDHDDVFRILKESNPTAVDYLLRRKAANQMTDDTRTSSCTSHGAHSPKTLSPQRFAPAFADDLDEKAEPESDSSDPKSGTKPNDGTEQDGDAFVRATGVRMSYQQAMGHLPYPLNDLTGEGSPSKLNGLCSTNAEISNNVQNHFQSVNDDTKSAGNPSQESDSDRHVMSSSSNGDLSSTPTDPEIQSLTGGRRRSSESKSSLHSSSKPREKVNGVATQILSSSLQLSKSEGNGDLNNNSFTSAVHRNNHNNNNNNNKVEAHRFVRRLPRVVNSQMEPLSPVATKSRIEPASRQCTSADVRPKPLPRTRLSSNLRRTQTDDSKVEATSTTGEVDTLRETELSCARDDFKPPGHVTEFCGIRTNNDVADGGIRSPSWGFKDRDISASQRSAEKTALGNRSDSEARRRRKSKNGSSSSVRREPCGGVAKDNHWVGRELTGRVCKEAEPSIASSSTLLWHLENNEGKNLFETLV